MFKDKITIKNIGISMLIIASLLLISEFVAVLSGALFIISKESVVTAYPSRTIIFILYSLVKIILPLLAIILGFKYLKNKPLKNNKKLGQAVIIASFIYFILQLILIGIANTGLLAFVNAVLWSIYFFILGTALKTINQATIVNGKQ